MRNTHQSQWNFLRENSILRGAISFSIDFKELKLIQIERALGISAYKISAYLKNRRPSMSNYDIIRLCEYLGIELSLKINACGDVSESPLDEISLHDPGL